MSLKRSETTVRSESVFHEGEQLAQARVRMRERMAQIGSRVIRDFMPDEHRELFEKLPYVIIGSLDAEGWPWASMLLGEAGFMHTPTARELVVHALPAPADPSFDNLQAEAPLGLLGIELHTRRRNRMNGKVSALTARGFTLHVAQSFGNCKKYIQARTPLQLAPRLARESVAEPQTKRLSRRAVSLLRQADTAFIATASRLPTNANHAEGVDVSHRGGEPGFLSVIESESGTILKMPDYSGNFMFNTLGNIEVNPRAGLLVPNFQTGKLLSLTCRAKIIWEGREIEHFAGAERLLELSVEQGVLFQSPTWFDWSEAEASPFNPPHSHSVAQR